METMEGPRKAMKKRRVETTLLDSRLDLSEPIIDAADTTPSITVLSSTPAAEVAPTIETEKRVGQWTKEEDARLKEIVPHWINSSGGIMWAKVSAAMGTRTTAQCRSRWKDTLDPALQNFKYGLWTPDEDERLRAAVEEASGGSKRGGINWVQVANAVGNRSRQQCINRYKDAITAQQAGVTIGRWSAEEDARLQEALLMYGESKGGAVDWVAVAKHVGTRSTSQVRDHVRDAAPGGKEGVRTGKWSAEEDDKLREAVRLYDGQGLGGGVCWVKVSAHMGGERLSHQCRVRWKSIGNTLITSIPWTQEEENLLAQAVEAYQDSGKRGGVNWVKVSEEVGSHSAMECQIHFTHELKPKIRNMQHGPWSTEEDEKLQIAAEKYKGYGALGGIDWHKVSEEVVTRNMLQCRNRWSQTLKPYAHGVNTGPWTEEEVALLKEAVELYSGHGKSNGVDWVSVVKHMGGTRSMHQCTIRYTQTLKPSMDGAKTGNWSAEEDELLKEAVVLYSGHGRKGKIDWGKVSEYIGTRTPHTCCSHFMNTINPQMVGVRTGTWLQEEDALLLEAVEMYSGKGKRGGVGWVKVAEHVGSRSATQCRLRMRDVAKRNDPDESSEMSGVKRTAGDMEGAEPSHCELSQSIGDELRAEAV